jgi:dihydroneopterin aldolase
MTRLLASVMDAAEAALALAGGADIIDCKDPRRGALGALPIDVVAQVRDTIAGRRPVSATLGDLPMVPALLAERAVALAASGVDFVKIGLFDAPACVACIEALAPVARSHRLVGVLFADRHPELRLIPLLARAGFAGVMVDTADKSGGSLRRHLDERALRALVAAVRAAGMLSGLAGSLRLEDIGPLRALQPDYLGFRSALCEGQIRAQRLGPGAVAAVRRAMGAPVTPGTRVSV